MNISRICSSWPGGMSPKSPAFPALNVRLSDMAATVALEQLKKLPSWMKKRQAAGRTAEAILSRYPFVLHARPTGARCSYWYCLLRLDEQRTRLTTNEFLKMVQAEGIPCWQRGSEILPDWEIFRRLNRNPRAFAQYRPLTLRKGQYRAGQWPQARQNTRRFMTLPINQYTGASELRDLERALEKVFSARH